MFAQVNFLAVLVSAVAAFVLAFLWYMPPVFGLRWGELTKRYTGLSDAEVGSNLPIKAGLWFVGFLVNAVALALIINLTQINDISSALRLGVIIAVGFGAVMGSWPPIHARQPFGIWLMNTGLFLVQQIAMASILTIWQ